ncbi:MAG TPA: hypothetical protein VLT47_11165 [Anaeromyxobacteraceae bacterium]|nr:hypothetical protein [Anaeromyxobacteraceae bacterium]
MKPLPTPEEIADALVTEGRIHRYDDEEARLGARAAYAAVREALEAEAKRQEEAAARWLSGGNARAHADCLVRVSALRAFAARLGGAS